MKKTARVVDSITDQLRELLTIRRPRKTYLPPDLQLAIETYSEQHIGTEIVVERGQSHLNWFGNWVYFSWTNRLVHILPEQEFFELRTARNRYKLTFEEQRRLGTKRIGIVGLSVGGAAAVTCALEDIGGTFRLADFDALSLGNMNRLKAGVADIGLPKMKIAARQMYEINPYLNIELFEEGVTESNLVTFFGGEHPLELLIEECDSLNVKVLVREKARRRRIPVIMETSDRGLLEVERFDLEPLRPTFHGLVGDINVATLKGLSSKEKAPFLLKLLGDMSPGCAASLAELDDTITDFPQLATAVALGGAVAADISQRILLKQHQTSGRFYVDLEALILDSGEQHIAAPQSKGLGPDKLEPLSH